jgi:hypothetical protein
LYIAGNIGRDLHIRQSFFSVSIQLMLADCNARGHQERGKDDDD